MLTTAHAKIDVFKRSISLEVGNEKVIFKLRNDLHDMKSEYVLMIQSNIITEEDELMNIESNLFTYNTNTCESCHILVVDTDLFTYEIVTQETYDEIAHKCCLNTKDAIGEKTKPVLGKKISHWCASIYRQNKGIQEDPAAKRFVTYNMSNIQAIQTTFLHSLRWRGDKGLPPSKIPHESLR
ncbi:hypothetical protein Tco_1507567 [Tanacetum coccineum]